MSFYSYLMASHLNQVQAGKRVTLFEFYAISPDGRPASVIAEKTAFTLACIGRGLIKIGETALTT